VQKVLEQIQYMRSLAYDHRASDNDSGGDLVHKYEFFILAHGHYTSRVSKSTVVFNFGSTDADGAHYAKNGF
jgi:hypothetical protein